jgi:hypothetical protein
MDSAPILCPHCAAATTLDDWEVVQSLEFVGVMAQHRGACGGQAWLFPAPPSSPGALRIEARPVRPVPADAPRPVITGYARICANRACNAEGLAHPLADDDDLTRAARCPSCDAPMQVYTCYQGAGLPMRRYELL